MEKNRYNFGFDRWKVMVLHVWLILLFACLMMISSGLSYQTVGWLLSLSNNHSTSNTPGESRIWRNRSSTSPRTHIHPTESPLMEITYILKLTLSSLYYATTTRLIFVGLLVIPRPSIKHHHTLLQVVGTVPYVVFSTWDVTTPVYTAKISAALSSFSIISRLPV
jgi:hypothetical protein